MRSLKAILSPRGRKPSVNAFIAVVVLMLCGTLLIEIHRLKAEQSQLEMQVAQLQQDKAEHLRRHLSSAAEQDPQFFSDDDQLIIYNRVPKTGSTSFAGIAYELCTGNRYHVLHVNITRNLHTISIADQIRFIQNITEWTEKKPAIYHGHFAYIDFAKLGYNHRRPVYINVIREPLDRMLSYYYFIRFGDNFRPSLKRRRHNDKETFDECVENDGDDCDPRHLWLQIPFFCGHAYKCRTPGSRWALEQAKHNLVHNYLVVGITEQLGDFIAVLEVTLPRFFKGASDLYVNGKNSHLRKTNKKDKPKPETVAKIQQSDIWKMENEFYEFAVSQFTFIKSQTFLRIEDKDVSLHQGYRQIFELSDGFHIEKANRFHYEKVRPR